MKNSDLNHYSPYEGAILFHKHIQDSHHKLLNDYDCPSFL